MTLPHYPCMNYFHICIVVVSDNWTPSWMTGEAGIKFRKKKKSHGGLSRGLLKTGAPHTTAISVAVKNKAMGRCNVITFDLFLGIRGLKFFALESCGCTRHLTNRPSAGGLKGFARLETRTVCFFSCHANCRTGSCAVFRKKSCATCRK